jgi:hypothetical protein
MGVMHKIIQLTQSWLDIEGGLRFGCKTCERTLPIKCAYILHKPSMSMQLATHNKFGTMISQMCKLGEMGRWLF